MIKIVKKIIFKLKKKKINLSLAESCTGGMLAQHITSVSGASKVFKFSVVAYSNESKIKYLMVPYKLIKKYGAVSEECCSSMLNGLEKISKTRLNVAITGVAGPSGGTKQKPVGLVFIGIKKNDKIKINRYLFKKQNRESVRKNSVKKALDIISDFI
jgi:nicotinamide-nucleotide amidase